MADKDEIDDIYGEDDAEDELTAKLREAVQAASEDTDEDDDGGLDAPMDTPEDVATVSQEEGLDLADKARTGKKPLAKTEKTEQAEGQDTKEKSEAPEAKEADPAEGLESSDLSQLVDGLDEGRKKEIGRRLSEASRITGLFRGHEAELQRHGATPEIAVQRFLELNRFAQQSPDEYVAWIATQTGGDKPAEVLEKAAGRLGFKLVPNQADDEDDFLDPEAKALKEENARLKAQLAGSQPDFGPDAPQRVQTRQAQQQLQEFVTARDPSTGQPLRPHFERLQPRIAQLASAHVQSTQQPVTVADLDRFYTQAVGEVREIAGVSLSAAQGTPSVADQIKTKAAATSKAKAASKSIDGTGQGASRRPALPDGASLDETLRYFAQQGQD